MEPNWTATWRLLCISVLFEDGDVTLRLGWSVAIGFQHGFGASVCWVAGVLVCRISRTRSWFIFQDGFQDRQQMHSEADCRFLFEVSYLKQSLGKSRNVTQWATKPPPILMENSRCLNTQSHWSNHRGAVASCRLMAEHTADRRNPASDLR